MEACRVYDGSYMTNVLLKNERSPFTSEAPDFLWAPTSSASSHGTSSMVNFEDFRGESYTEKPFLAEVSCQVESCNEGPNVCFRKTRLTANQVQFLERSFDADNKLDPDRKIQLARELGLQPRQVAIWYQNRRARCKTKLLEKEYGTLRASYDKLKADFDTLCAENKKLRNEVHLLAQKLLLRSNGKPNPEPCDPISPLDFQPKNPCLSPQDSSKIACKQEDVASSGKSEVFDSDIPHHTDGKHSAMLEPADFDNSDSCQDENDRLGRSLLQPPSCFPKLEADCLQPNSCILGFPVQDRGTWLWQC